jgi:hypothetical protein
MKSNRILSIIVFAYLISVGITKDPAFTDNILFLLLEKPKS